MKNEELTNPNARDAESETRNPEPGTRNPVPVPQASSPKPQAPEDTTTIKTQTDLIATAKERKRETPPGAPCLLVLSGPLKHKKALLIAGETMLGRNRQCHLRLTDPTVSQMHAVIARTPEGVFVRDLGSSNGTLVNGNAVQGDHPLRDRDRLQLGNTELEFRANS